MIAQPLIEKILLSLFFLGIRTASLFFNQEFYSSRKTYFFCDPDLIFTLNFCDSDRIFTKNVTLITVLFGGRSQGDDNKPLHLYIIQVIK